MCLCDCGKKKVYSSDHLTRKKGPVKSCGCLKKTIKGPNHHHMKRTYSQEYFIEMCRKVAKNNSILKEDVNEIA